MIDVAAPSPFAAGPGPERSVLFYKLRLQLHWTKAVDFAIDIMIALNEANIFNLGADLEH